MTDSDQQQPQDKPMRLRDTLSSVLAAALGEWHGGPLPDLPEVSAAAESRRFIPRAAASVDRFLRRRGAEIRAQTEER